MQHSIEIPLEKFWNDLIIEKDRAIKKIRTQTPRSIPNNSSKKAKTDKKFQPPL
jgi:hypothetical protein